MFIISTDQSYMLYAQSVDMRKSFDSLSGLIKNDLSLNPRSEEAYLFINKNRDKAKLLRWNRGSYELYLKRHERGTFELPTYGKKVLSIKLDYSRMVLLMDGLSIKNLHQRKR